MIPPFNDNGVLPCDSEATPEELHQSHLVTGEGLGSAHWDAAWRAELTVRITQVFDLFSRAGGVVEFWIDGSFVESIDHPQDIDAYFTLRDPREWLTLPDRLNKLEGADIWTWNPSDRRLFPGSLIPKPPFWDRYHVDIYPDLGRPSGIFDRDGNPMTFAEAFRQQRSTFRRKGIIRLRRRNDQI